MEVYDLDRTVFEAGEYFQPRICSDRRQRDDRRVHCRRDQLPKSHRAGHRAILPVPGALADPTLELRDGNGVVIASNDNWRSDQEAEITASTVPPTNDLESTIVVDACARGAHRDVRGKEWHTGVALVEVYALN